MFSTNMPLFHLLLSLLSTQPLFHLISLQKYKAVSTWHFLPEHVCIVMKEPAGFLCKLNRQGFFKTFPTNNILLDFCNVCVRLFFFPLYLRKDIGTAEFCLFSMASMTFLLISFLLICSNTVRPLGNSCARF